MSIQQATTFWIEAGAMQGGSRNQLEMSNDLAEYFGIDARNNEVVTIQLAAGVQHVRPFVYRGDDYGHWTERWRLCLPTAQMGGPAYPQRVVRFDKVMIGQTLVFNLTVADVGSPQHINWQQASASPNGQAGQTSTGREWGWWS